MAKSWQELQTIDDFIESCKEDAGKYKADLSKNEKENLAATILSLTFTDHFKKWEKRWDPLLANIEMLASDLEWSNTNDVDEDWEKLIKYIDELAREVDSSDGSAHGH